MGFSGMNDNERSVEKLQETNILTVWTVHFKPAENEIFSPHSKWCRC
jgi:hypothetical protein